MKASYLSKVSSLKQGLEVPLEQQLQKAASSLAVTYPYSITAYNQDSKRPFQIYSSYLQNQSKGFDNDLKISYFQIKQKAFQTRQNQTMTAQALGTFQGNPQISISMEYQMKKNLSMGAQVSQKRVSDNKFQLSILIRECTTLSELNQAIQNNVQMFDNFHFNMAAFKVQTLYKDNQNKNIYEKDDLSQIVQLLNQYLEANSGSMSSKDIVNYFYMLRTLQLDLDPTVERPLVEWLDREASALEPKQATLILANSQKLKSLDRITFGKLVSRAKENIDSMNPMEIRYVAKAYVNARNSGLYEDKEFEQLLSKNQHVIDSSVNHVNLNSNENQSVAKEFGFMSSVSLDNYYKNTYRKTQVIKECPTFQDLESVLKQWGHEFSKFQFTTSAFQVNKIQRNQQNRSTQEQSALAFIIQVMDQLFVANFSKIDNRGLTNYLNMHAQLNEPLDQNIEKLIIEQIKYQKASLELDDVVTCLWASQKLKILDKIPYDKLLQRSKQSFDKMKPLDIFLVSKAYSNAKTNFGYEDQELETLFMRAQSTQQDDQSRETSNGLPFQQKKAVLKYQLPKLIRESQGLQDLNTIIKNNKELLNEYTFSALTSQVAKLTKNQSSITANEQRDLQEVVAVLTQYLEANSSQINNSCKRGYLYMYGKLGQDLDLSTQKIILQWLNEQAPNLDRKDLVWCLHSSRKLRILEKVPLEKLIGRAKEIINSMDATDLSVISKTLGQATRYGFYEDKEMEAQLTKKMEEIEKASSQISL